MTAAQGRCAGCHIRGPLKNISRHVVQCPAWAKLFRDDSVSALGPAKEYARWVAEDRDREHAQDLAARVTDTLARRAVSVDRFRVPDLLED